MYTEQNQGQHKQGHCCTGPIDSEKGMSAQDNPHLKIKKKTLLMPARYFDDLCFDGIIRMTRPLKLQPAF